MSACVLQVSHLILATSRAVLLAGIQATSAEDVMPDMSSGNCSNSKSASCVALRSGKPGSEKKQHQFVRVSNMQFYSSDVSAGYFGLVFAMLLLQHIERFSSLTLSTENKTS